MELDISKGLFISDGCVVRKDVLILATGFNTDPDQETSRIVFVLNGKWCYFDVEVDSVISVTAIGSTGYAVGSYGSVFELPLHKNITFEAFGNQARSWVIEDAAEYGEITRIRSVSSYPYCCGQSGQVYRLEGNKWVCVDYGLRSDNGPSLEDIGGSSPSDVYVVGIHGAMYHFDGCSWKSIDLPTNQNLSNIRCRSDGVCYVCGDDGLILRGNGHRWSIISESVPGKNYWGLEIFEGVVYLAHGKGIDCLTTDKVEPVSLSIEGHLTFNRLHGCDGQLWSFGTDHMLKYDGNLWSKVIIPYTPE